MLTRRPSNCSKSGTRRKPKSAMRCCGETRYSSSPPRWSDRDPTYRLTRTHQVEYLVVSYSKDSPRVLLSLRQADILKALASDAELSAKGGCVPALQDVAGTKYVPTYLPRYLPTFPLSTRSQYCANPQSRRAPARLPPGVWKVHARGHAWETMGHRIQRAPRRRAQHETEVKSLPSQCRASLCRVLMGL